MNKILERLSAFSLGFASFLTLAGALTNTEFLTRMYSDLFYDQGRGFSELADLLLAPALALTAVAMVLTSKPKALAEKKSLLVLSAGVLSSVAWLAADLVWQQSLNLGAEIGRPSVTGLVETSRWFLILSLGFVLVALLAKAGFGGTKESPLKMTKPQVASMLLLAFGLLNLALFSESSFSSSFAQFLNAGIVDFDTFIVLAKFLILPVLSIVAAVFAFLPQLRLVFSQIEIYLGIVSLLAIAAIISLAYRSADSTFDSNFWSYLVGAPGDSLSLFSGAKLTVLLAVTAFALSLFTFLERFGIKVSFEKFFQSKFMLSLGAFLKTVLDSSLEKFISRKVSGVLYIITAWLFIAGAALFEVWAFIEAVRGDVLALAMFLVAPAFALLTLIVIRMAFEAGIALIVIAENTKK